MVPLSTVSDRSSTAVVAPYRMTSPSTTTAGSDTGVSVGGRLSAAQGGADGRRWVSGGRSTQSKKTNSSHTAPVRRQRRRAVGADRGRRSRSPAGSPPGRGRPPRRPRRAWRSWRRTTPGVPQMWHMSAYFAAVGHGPPLAATADQDRQPLLHRLRVVGRVAELEVAARRTWSASSRSSADITATLSSNRSERSCGRIRSMPYAACSLTCQPAPSPAIARPPLTWSSAANLLATTAGAGRCRPGPSGRAGPGPSAGQRRRAASIASSIGSSLTASSSVCPMKWSGM